MPYRRQRRIWPALVLIAGGLLGLGMMAMAAAITLTGCPVERPAVPFKGN